MKAYIFTVVIALSVNAIRIVDDNFNNSCVLKNQLTPPTQGAPTSFLPKCPQWVIDTTDAVWHQGTENLNTTLKRFFHQNFTSHQSFGRAFVGMDALYEAVVSTRKAFPDLRIHVDDVYCVGNDIDGYKTVMPDTLVGTNRGATAYGPATGARVAYDGIAITYVQLNPKTEEWQYMAEWILHDELSLVDQLGFIPEKAFNRPKTKTKPIPNCGINLPSWSAPQSNYEPPSNSDPLGKAIVKSMDALISGHVDCFDWSSWSKAMEPFWTKDLIYDTNWVPFDVPILGNNTGLREWFDHEHIPFNIAFHNCTFSQMIFAGSTGYATTTTYANALWKNDFAGIPTSKREVKIRIFDFYIIDVDQRKISYNWMLLDLPYIMLQAGYRVLPKPTLREGWVQPPRAMDGIPAPISLMVNKEDEKPAYNLVKKIMDDMWIGDESNCQDLWTKDMHWYGPVGIGSAQGCQEFMTYVIDPFRGAFSNRSLDLDVHFCEGMYCGMHGRIIGVHSGFWLGENATNRQIDIRFGMHFRVEKQGEAFKVADGWALFDIPAAFNKMGINLWDRIPRADEE